MQFNYLSVFFFHSIFDVNLTELKNNFFFNIHDFKILVFIFKFSEMGWYSFGSIESVISRMKELCNFFLKDPEFYLLF